MFCFILVSSYGIPLRVLTKGRFWKGLWRCHVKEFAELDTGYNSMLVAAPTIALSGSREWKAAVCKWSCWGRFLLKTQIF